MIYCGYTKSTRGESGMTFTHAVMCFVLLLAPCDMNTHHWKCIKEKNGISIYARPAKGSPMKEFQGTAVIDAPLETILAVLEDVPSQPRWMERCKKAAVIEKLNAYESIIHNITDVPWPLQDRDAIIRNTTKVDNRGILTIAFRSLDNYKFPLPPHTIRMTALKGAWIFESIDRNRTRATYRVRSNPGIHLPAFMLNHSSRMIPYNSLMGLRTMTQKKQYREKGKELLVLHRELTDKILHGRVMTILTKHIKDPLLLERLKNDNQLFSIIRKENRSVETLVRQYITENYYSVEGTWQKK
jgi:hypothetical protein